MRNPLLVTAISMVAAFSVLGGCAREEPAEAPATAPDTAETGTPAEQPGTDNPADVSPMNAQTWIDDVTIGSEIGADGMIPAGKTGDDFAPGQAVHLSMEVGDAPPNSAVRVIWFGPNETKVGEETKPVTPDRKYLTFSAQDTKSWVKGDYRAEVWVGDEKVNQQQFQIVDKKDAAS